MTKHKKKNKNQEVYSVFAPVWPTKQGTPKTDYSSKNVSGGGSSTVSSGGPGPVPYGGSAGGPGGGGGGSGMVTSIIPPTRQRVMHELKMIVGNIKKELEEGAQAGTMDPAWVGYSALTPGTDRSGGPTPGGPGFTPVPPGQGNRYDMQKSPGLGFKSEKAWKVWGNIVDILQKRPTLPIYAVMQAAMARSGVRFGDIDAGEQRLLEMGVEWYLSNPKNQPKDSDGGGQSGFGATQLNAVTY